MIELVLFFSFFGIDSAVYRYMFLNVDNIEKLWNTGVLKLGTASLTSGIKGKHFQRSNL